MTSLHLLFSHSYFYFTNKDKLVDAKLLAYQSAMNWDEKIESFHPKRKEEYILGRLCAAEAYFQCFGTNLKQLDANSDRSANWPSQAVGSISHDQYLIGAAVAKSSDLFGLGIDFEVLGRVKKELKDQIMNSHDLENHPHFSADIWPTFVFSAKEALFKALHPRLKVFFGFDTAAITEVNYSEQSFCIELIAKIAPHFGPDENFKFYGRFQLIDKSILTFIEIPNNQILIA